jgi:hypothetical protein
MLARATARSGAGAFGADEAADEEAALPASAQARLRATLAPVAEARPPPGLFEAIFGATFSATY